jgi:NAD(P)-dependent dehydrogenase (short-subunit alcohol dehydrogenase family)
LNAFATKQLSSSLRLRALVSLASPGTSGLGAGFISLIAAAWPSKIFLSGRSKTKAHALISKVSAISPSTELIFLEADLSSLASVRQMAQTFLAQSNRLDVLMCNAGIMGTPPGLSADGYEIQFGTNHVGHALLIKLLLPVLLSTASQPDADVRIISMSSVAHTLTPPSGIEFDSLRTPQDGLAPFYQPSNFTRYGQSKLANLLYARQLALHYPQLLSVSVHPGFVKTDMVSGASLRDRAIVAMASKGKWTKVDEGPWNQTWAATAEREGLRNGAYYEPIGVDVRSSTKWVDDKVLGERLWTWTEGELEAWVL